MVLLSFSRIVSVLAPESNRTNASALPGPRHRKNQGYTDKVTQTWAYSRFSFSRLGAEIHACYPEEITSIVWGQNDIVTLLAVARLGTLRVVAS